MSRIWDAARRDFVYHGYHPGLSWTWAALALLLGALAFSVTLVLASPAHATNVNVQLEDLDSSTAARVLEQLKAAQDKKKSLVEKMVPTADKATEWADVGVKLAGAIGAAAKALSVEVNDFVKTPVGKWAMIFLFWYLLGAKIWAILVGIFAWVGVGSIILWSYRRLHLGRRVKRVVDGKTEVTVEYYPWRQAVDSKGNETGSDAKVASAVFHAGAFLAWSVICLIIVA